LPDNCCCMRTLHVGVGRRNAGRDFGILGARTEKDSETIRAQRRKSFENYF